MRSIDVTTEILIGLQTPVALIVLPEGLEVVDVRTLGAQDLTEESLLSHIEGRELEEVVDTVLQHHAVTLSTLCGIDDIPSLLEGHHRGHFAGYVLTLVHRIDHHLGVVLPVGSDIDEVNIVTIAECLPGILLTAIASSLS